MNVRFSAATAKDRDSAETVKLLFSAATVNTIGSTNTHETDALAADTFGRWTMAAVAVRPSPMTVVDAFETFSC